MQILPLTGNHDRQGFDCGRPELNDWLLHLLVDAIDDKAAAFYAHFGFEAFVDDPLNLFLPVR